MFYIGCDTDSADAFWLVDDDGKPLAFKTEAEAVTSAKDYCVTSLIFKAVTSVTEKTTYTVKKLS